MVKTLELAKKLVTAEEYLKMDRIAIREKIGKYELFNQKLIFMPRGTPQHGELIMNVGTLLNMQKCNTALNSGLSPIQKLFA